MIVASLVAPAIGASDAGKARIAKPAAPVNRVIGTFTPAAADPKLAALFARGGLETSGFRFTPSETRRNGNRAITVAVRARSNQTAQVAGARAQAGSTAPTVGLAPIAYNLGVAVGWKRFAISGDMTRVDLGGQPGSREALDVGVSYTGRRFSGAVKAGADRPLADAPRFGADDPSYSIDVGGSYSVSRRLDVTAGVRYKSENFRLDRLADDRRDSQAVYVGTALRF